MSTIRPLFLTLSILFCFRNAEAQAVRLDSFSSTTNAQCAPGVQCPLLVIPGTQVNFCNGNAVGVVSTAGTVVTLVSGPSFIGAAGTIQIAGTSYLIATVVSSSILVLSPPGAGTQANVPYSSLSGCLGNPITTYTSSSAGTACGTTAQLTPQLGGACVAAADNQGNYGIWALPFSGFYYLRTPATAGGVVSGPYPITLGASAGTPAGATVDANYATLALACAAAGSGTLYVTELWNNTPTQTLACGLNFLGNGKIQTATSATVTITGSVTAPFNQQIFDSTTNSGSTFIFSGTKLAAIYDQWWGSSSLVPACGAGGGTGAPVYITMAWLNVPSMSCAGFLNFQLAGSIQPAASAFFATRGYTAVTRQTVWDLSNSGSSIRISSPAMGQQLYASNFSTFAGACSTAATYGSSLTVQLPITGLTTQSCGANLVFVGTGSLQAASSQVVTVSGTITAPPVQIFDTSVGGAGSILLTGQSPAVYPNWFGAKMDGSTDDAAAWTATIASCTACTITMPTNVYSHVASTINLTGAGQRLECPGKTSAISGSGITILKMSGAVSGGQVFENCQIFDPTGNSSTIALEIDNGTGNSNQVYVNNVTLTGNSSNRLGIAFQLNGGVNIHINQMNEEFFGTAMQLNSSSPAPITTLNVSNSNLFNNSTYCVDIEDSVEGDYRFSGNTFEDCATGFKNNTGSVLASGNHFENNTTNQLNNVGIWVGVGNVFEGGAMLNTGVMTSYGETWNSATVTNNSVGGIGLPGFLAYYPILGLTVSGTGWSQVWGPNGMAQRNNPNSSAFAFTGLPTQGVTLDQGVQAPSFTSPSAASFTISGCGAIGAHGPTSGVIVSNVSGTCATTITFATAAPHEWLCTAWNQTSWVAAGGVSSSYNAIGSTSRGPGTTGCVISGTTTSGDQINVFAVPY